MLGLYLHTLKIGQKYCNMLSILDKLTLQKKLQNLVTNNVFWTKSINTTTTKQKKSNIKTLCRGRELNPGPLAPKRMRYRCTTESTKTIDCSQAIWSK